MGRTDGSTDRSRWSKGDGKIYGLSWDLTELWSPLDPGVVPWCYEYDDRDLNRLECPGPGVWNGYNGTVEGAGAIGPDNVIYFGRGDGAVYGVDMDSGEVVWRFDTYNPLDRDDPEGGGEVITPILYHDGMVYFATVAPPNIPHVAWETNAIYGVALDSPEDHHWRYPPDERTLDGEEFLAAPALSPDGETVYFGSMHAIVADTTMPANLYAFETEVDWEEPDPFLWRKPTHDPAHTNSTILVDRLLVGSNGDLYLGGTRLLTTESPYTNPRAVALRLDADGEPSWNAAVELPAPFAGHLVQGLSLREQEGEPPVLYVGQGYNNHLGGAMHALEGETGEVSWSWRAGEHEVAGAFNDASIGANGNLYFGVRGTVANGGWIIALDPDGNELWRFRQDQGAIDWSPPTIGRNGSLYWGDRALELVPYAVYAPGECPEQDARPRLWAILGAEPSEPLDPGSDAGSTPDPEPDAGHVPPDAGTTDSLEDSRLDADSSPEAEDVGSVPPSAGGGDDGCGCSAATSSVQPWVCLLAFLLAWRRRSPR